MSFYQRMVGAVAAGSMMLFAAQSQADTVDVMIRGGPGGGWDTTGRQAMQAPWPMPAIFTDGANFTNKGGAAGTIGARRVRQRQPGQRQRPDLHGRHHGGRHRAQQLAGQRSTRPRRIARLTNEYLAIAVSAELALQDDRRLRRGAEGRSRRGAGRRRLGRRRRPHPACADRQGPGRRRDQDQLHRRRRAAPRRSPRHRRQPRRGHLRHSEFKTFVESGRIRILAVSLRRAAGRRRRADAEGVRHQRRARQLARRARRARHVGRGPRQAGSTASTRCMRATPGRRRWRRRAGTTPTCPATNSPPSWARRATRMTGVLKDVGLVQ